MSVVLANKCNGENKVAIPRAVADRLESDGVVEWNAYGGMFVSDEHTKNGDAIVNTLRTTLEALGLSLDVTCEPEEPTGGMRLG